MDVKIQLFALLREIVGQETITLSLPEGATGEDLKRELTRQYPNLKPHLPSVRLALEDEFYPAHLPLPKGKEIALIPPVSGG